MYLAQLTSEHITQLIVLANLIVTAILVPYVQSLRTNQKTNINKTTASLERVENKADNAYHAANNLNVKLEDATQVAHHAKEVVAEAKQIVEEVKQTISKP